MKRSAKRKLDEFDEWLDSAGVARQRVAANEKSSRKRPYAQITPEYFLEIYHAVQSLKTGNVDELETVIAFLERDEWFHGSGYVKEFAWKYLHRVELKETQRQRLLKVALRYLQKRAYREFFPMCRFIRGIADQSFQAVVRRMTESDDVKEMSRALILSAYLQSSEEGERQRLAMKELWRSNKRRERGII